MKRLVATPVAARRHRRMRLASPAAAGRDAADIRDGRAAGARRAGASAVPPVSVGPRTIPPAPTPPPEAAPAPPPPPPPTAPPVPPAQRGRFVVLNFDNADIETVIQAASEIIGFNYVLAPDVRGKVTVQTSGRIAQEEVFGVLLAILEVQGFTAVKSGNLYKIVRIEGARERAVPTIVGPTADPNRTTDEIITQIVPIKYSSVADLSALLRPLISTRGTLIAHRETNVLIITDAASNVDAAARHHPPRRRAGGAGRAADHPHLVRRRRRAGDDPDPALRQRPRPLRHAGRRAGRRRRRWRRRSRACRCRRRPGASRVAPPSARP